MMTIAGLFARRVASWETPVKETAARVHEGISVRFPPIQPFYLINNGTEWPIWIHITRIPVKVGPGETVEFTSEGGRWTVRFASEH